MLVAM
jgi:hypothetical protein